MAARVTRPDKHQTKRQRARSITQAGPAKLIGSKGSYLTTTEASPAGGQEAETTRVSPPAPDYRRLRGPQLT